MLVVVLTAGGALLALYSYNTLKASDPDRLETVLFAVQQQAGVMAAICAAIFAVITALRTGKAVLTPSTPVVARPTFAINQP